MSRTVHVRRTIVAEYAVETEEYDGFTEDEIRAWETEDPDGIALEIAIGNIVSEGVEVWFTGEPEASA